MKELLTEHQETMQAIYSQEILSVKEEWDMPHTNTEGMNRVRCEALARTVPRYVLSVMLTDKEKRDAGNKRNSNEGKGGPTSTGTERSSVGVGNGERKKPTNIKNSSNAGTI